MKFKSIKMRASSKLWRMRMIRGLLQADLARISGISQPSISLMEKNGIKRADKALALARALNCTVEDLIDFTLERANNK